MIRGLKPAIDKLRPAAKGFVEKMPENYCAEVIRFSDDSDRTMGFTKDKDALKVAIDAAIPSRWLGGTALFDAICMAIDDITANDGYCLDSNAVVVMTDGCDQASKTCSATAVIKKAKDKGVPVFVIGLKSQEYPLCPEPLTTIAVQTGGVYYETDDPNKLKDIYEKIGTTLTGQYVVEYTTAVCGSSSSPDVRRSLTVEVIAGTGCGKDEEEVPCPSKCK